MGHCHDALSKVQIVIYELPTGFFMHSEKDRPYLHEELVFAAILTLQGFPVNLF